MSLEQYCPLLDSPAGIPFRGEIPEYCTRRCETRWNGAVKNGVVVGGYDSYRHVSFDDDNDECAHRGDIVFSHEALVAIDSKTRQYVIVDECDDCGTQLGEAGYEFICADVSTQSDSNTSD